jgi:hypothetical protein
MAAKICNWIKSRLMGSSRPQPGLTLSVSAVPRCEFVKCWRTTLFIEILK